jgi:hypothetical protein
MFDPFERAMSAGSQPVAPIPAASGPQAAVGELEQRQVPPGREFTDTDEYRAFAQRGGRGRI